MDKRSLGFVKFVSYEGKIYFNDIFTGNIVRLDLSDDVFEVLSQNFNDGKMQYGAIQQIEKNIIFAPRNATDILIYNTENESVREISLDSSRIEGKPLFLNMISKGDWIYFIPGKYSAIVAWNNKTNVVEYIDVNKEKGKMFSSCNGWMEENKLCMLTEDGTLMKVDHLKGTTEEKQISMINFTPLINLDCGENQIFGGFGPKIMVLNKKSGKIQWIDTYKNCEEPVDGYGKFLSINQDIYMVAINQPKIYKLSLQTKEISSFIDFEWGSEDRTIWNQFVKCDVIGGETQKNTLLIYSTIRNAILEIDVDTKAIRYHECFRQEKNNRNKWILEYKKNTGSVIEGSMVLEDFLENLIS